MNRYLLNSMFYLDGMFLLRLNTIICLVFACINDDDELLLKVLPVSDAAWHVTGKNCWARNILLLGHMELFVWFSRIWPLYIVRVSPLPLAQRMLRWLYRTQVQIQAKETSLYDSRSAALYHISGFLLFISFILLPLPSADPPDFDQNGIQNILSIRKHCLSHWFLIIKAAVNQVISMSTHSNKILVFRFWCYVTFWVIQSPLLNLTHEWTVSGSLQASPSNPSIHNNVHTVKAKHFGVPSASIEECDA